MTDHPPSEPCAAATFKGASLGKSALTEHLTPAGLRAGIEIRDWLLSEARGIQDPKTVLLGLCERLIEADVPLDRVSVVVTTIHAEFAAIGRIWQRGEGLHREAYPYHPGSRAEYERSPYFEAHESRGPVSLDLSSTPDERFGIVPRLKAEGYRHYVCYPIFFANGDKNGISFSTRAGEGFSASDLAVFAFIMPAYAAVMEITAGYHRLDQLLRIYVGGDPHNEILAGSVRRGDVKRIRSAILFADMRNYTATTSRMEPEAAAELLNEYFDCMVPPIEAAGGEVLKYMGDGLMAIFRDRGDDTGGAANAALDAARIALERLDVCNAGRPEGQAIGAGIALHHGEAAYGNVGSGLRLDFTVVGRDVNLASRVAKLNKLLSEPLLMTKAFADHLWISGTHLGAFQLDGFEEEVAVFRP